MNPTILQEIQATLPPGLVAVAMPPSNPVKEIAECLNGPEPEKVERKCLRCHVPFTASGKFNRLCTRCVGINAESLDLRSGGYAANDGETICDL